MWTCLQQRRRTQLWLSMLRQMERGRRGAFAGREVTPSAVLTARHHDHYDVVLATTYHTASSHAASHAGFQQRRKLLTTFLQGQGCSCLDRCLDMSCMMQDPSHLSWAALSTMPSSPCGWRWASRDGSLPAPVCQPCSVTRTTRASLMVH